VALGSQAGHHLQRTRQATRRTRNTTQRTTTTHAPPASAAVSHSLLRSSTQLCLITTNANKQVGFYGPIAPPVPNAPSSECPRTSIAARRCAAGSIRISRRASCCCSSATAGINIGANFKIYLLRQFCLN